MKPIRDSKLRTEEPDGTPDVEVFRRHSCGGQRSIVLNDRTVGCTH
jgi:hypothetical protein